MSCLVEVFDRVEQLVRSSGARIESVRCLSHATRTGHTIARPNGMMWDLSSIEDKAKLRRLQLHERLVSRRKSAQRRLLITCCT